MRITDRDIPTVQTQNHDFHRHKHFYNNKIQTNVIKSLYSH